MEFNLQRNRTIYGIKIPAFIQNGNNFFVDLAVFEDGIIECWKATDLESFQEKLKSRWVITEIKEGDSISIHGLGEWKIRKPNWLYTPETFYEYIKSKVLEMNPDLVNMTKIVDRKINGLTFIDGAMGTTFKEINKTMFTSKKIHGQTCDIFYQQDEKIYLAQIEIYYDGNIKVTRVPRNEEFQIEQLGNLVDSGKLFVEIENGSYVEIYGLGSFEIESRKYSTTNKDKVNEIRDTFNKLNNRPTSFEIFRKAYQDYLEDPSDENKKILKESYEKIPVHQRMFLGDMDTKDIPIRMAIYGEQEKENWSHRILAKKMGYSPLPDISLPTQKKDS